MPAAQELLSQTSALQISNVPGDTRVGWISYKDHQDPDALQRKETELRVQQNFAKAHAVSNLDGSPQITIKGLPKLHPGSKATDRFTFHMEPYKNTFKRQQDNHVQQVLRHRVPYSGEVTSPAGIEALNQFKRRMTTTTTTPNTAATSTTSASPP